MYNMKCKQIAYHRFGGIQQSLTCALFMLFFFVHFLLYLS